MALKILQSKKEYEKAIKRGLTLTDFNAPWCAPCRTQEPILERLSIRYEGQAVISTMNVDENQDIAATLGIQSIPTMIIFKNNKEIQRFVGVQSENTLSDAMNRLLEGGRFLMEKISFSDIAIVSCGTLNLELSHLKQEGFLDADKVFLHQTGAAPELS